LFINQHKIIFYRKAYVLLANVSGSSQSIPLSDADLIVLEHIATTDSPHDMLANIIADPLLKKAFPDLDQQQIRQRIEQYKQVNAILPAPSENPPEIKIEDFETQSGSDTEIVLQTDLRVRHSDDAKRLCCMVATARQVYWIKRY
jgi:hypothetical protein